jgi:hypothetical protein
MAKCTVMLLEEEEDIKPYVLRVLFSKSQAIDPSTFVRNEFGCVSFQGHCYQHEGRDLQR